MKYGIPCSDEEDYFHGGKRAKLDEIEVIYSPNNNASSNIFQNVNLRGSTHAHDDKREDSHSLAEKVIFTKLRITDAGNVQNPGKISIERNSKMGTGTVKVDVENVNATTQTNASGNLEMNANFSDSGKVSMTLPAKLDRNGFVEAKITGSFAIFYSTHMTIKQAVKKGEEEEMINEEQEEGQEIIMDEFSSDDDDNVTPSKNSAVGI